MLKVNKSLILFVLEVIVCSNSLPIDDNGNSKIYEVYENSIDENVGVINLSKFHRSLFGLPDNATTGARLATYDPETEKVNPEELGSYLEGDMLIPSNQGRNGLLSQSSRWPNAIVPFEIKGSFNAHQMALIEQGINEYHSKTCIRFKPRLNERDYVSIVNDNSGCWSSVGKIGGRQEINLQTPGCVNKVGTFMHEMMHALGFMHEQNRYERDEFINIQWDNIKSNVLYNFDKASSSSTYAFGVPYDYGSIMHYSAYAFSSNGRPTIVPKSAENMGQRDAFSYKDLQKINNMYNCNAASSVPSSNSFAPSIGSAPQRPPIQPQQPPASNQNPFWNFIGGLFSALGFGDEIDSSTDKNIDEQINSKYLANDEKNGLTKKYA